MLTAETYIVRNGYCSLSLQSLSLKTETLQFTIRCHCPTFANVGFYYIFFCFLDVDESVIIDNFVKNDRQCASMLLLLGGRAGHKMFDCNRLKRYCTELYYEWEVIQIIIVSNVQ